LTSNFLKVQMTRQREPNRMVELTIGGVTESGLREREMLPVIRDGDR
jgi:hypothetical protein